MGTEVLKQLSVKAILLLDSTSIGLPDKAKEDFPAPRNNVQPSAVKIHALYDLFGGIIRWFDVTPATTHDRKGFPPLDSLIGSLIIFDLGYWDFHLLQDMIAKGVYFLCRVKSNAAIKVVEVVSGISKSCIGIKFSSGRLDGFRGKIVEFIGELKTSGTDEIFNARVIGFWSYEDSQYHWYITNLKVSSFIIYPLYRLRWTIECLWKSWKSFLHFDEINTANKNIILSVTLIGLCAGLIAGAIAVPKINEESLEKQAAFSLQNVANIFLRIGRLLFDVIRGKLRGAKNKLIEMIELFKGDLFDSNYKRRTNTMRRITDEICKT